jgi:ApaG protein
MIYHASTHGLIVKVRPEFLEAQSDPEENLYLWAYHVRIENESDVTVQLRERHWRITDAFGQTRRVDGEGVIGMQPIIAPTEFFEYNSAASLTTPSGFMAGHYDLEDEDGNELHIQIPAFSLDSPYQTVVLQ